MALQDFPVKTVYFDEMQLKIVEETAYVGEVDAS